MITLWVVTMEQLDGELLCVPANAPFSVIGGRSSPLCRMTSHFADKPGASALKLRNLKTSLEPCGKSGSDKGSKDGEADSYEDPDVLKWGEEEVIKWLAVCGFPEYQVWN